MFDAEVREANERLRVKCEPNSEYVVLRSATAFLEFCTIN
jgi:hypothetical protein